MRAAVQVGDITVEQSEIFFAGRKLVLLRLLVVLSLKIYARHIIRGWKDAELFAR
jgi:hypothetical protein